jgi:hypothetical protein
MKLKYKEARERIIQAYMKEELNPQSECACFIGNLLGRSRNWKYATTNESIYAYSRSTESINKRILYSISVDEATISAQACKRIGKDLLDTYGYTPEQITRLENHFLSCTPSGTFWDPIYCQILTPEDDLFTAMESTLDMLRDIHIENGEVIEDDIPVFVKRTAACAA